MKKNIYISKEERQQLKRIQQKYCLSLSALINQIYWPIFKLAAQHGQTLKYLNDKKTFKGYGKFKTSIKCNWKPYEPQDHSFNQTIIITNIVKCYLYNDYKRITNDQEAINECKNTIENNLTKAYDPYWNYNDVLRANIKFWKENPKYMKEQGKNEQKN